MKLGVEWEWGWCLFCFVNVVLDYWFWVSIFVESSNNKLKDLVNVLIVFDFLIRIRLSIGMLFCVCNDNIY